MKKYFPISNFTSYGGFFLDLPSHLTLPGAYSFPTCLLTPLPSRVSGVCKRWDQFLDTHPFIWREVHFPTLNPQKPPKVSFLKTLRKRTGGGARSLVIPNAHTFQLSESKWLSLIQTTNPLMTNRLELGFIKRNLEGDWGFKLPPKPAFFQGLAHLRLSFHEITRPEYRGRGGAQPFVRQFVERARENIESISLVSMYLNDLNWPELPRLKVLQLTGPLNSTLNQLTPERRIDPVSLDPPRRRWGACVALGELELG